MAKAAPLPGGGTLNQPSLHGIAMDVAKLLDKAFRAPDIVVVVAFLPKRAAVPWYRPANESRCRNLQCLDGCGEHRNLRLRDEQVNVFRHHDISINTKAVNRAGPFEGVQENIAGFRIRKERQPVK